MDQALEPQKPVEEPVDMLWCSTCGAPSLEYAFWRIGRADGSLGAWECPECEARADSVARTQQDWMHYPLLIISRYYQIGLPAATIVLVLAFYGVWSIIAWLL